MSAKTIELLEEVLEYLEDNYDVRDGSYGEQTPNRAMSLGMQVERALDELKKAQALPQTSIEVHDTLIDAERWRHFRDLGETDRTVVLGLSEGQGHLLEHFIDKSRCGL
jgi:hypothetical protein